MTVAPPGTGVEARGPTAAMRPPSMTTVASASGGPPLPSMTVAPTIAVVACWAVVDGGWAAAMAASMRIVAARKRARVGEPVMASSRVVRASTGPPFPAR